MTVFRTSFVIRAALALALAAAPIASSAQDAADLSESEIAERLQRQFLDARTRGLRLAPAEGTGEARAEAAAQDVGVEYSAVAADDMVAVAITFDLDSAAIRPDQRPKLDRICDGMRGADGVEAFAIIGHTDASGPEDYNERLSRLRAEEVKRYMVDNCGFTPERLEAIGLGERRPLAGTEPRAPENRRVELQARVGS